MSLLAVLLCLLAQHAYPARGRRRLMAFYGRICLSVARRFNAGDRNSGVLAWFVLMAAVVVPAALLTWVAGRVHPFFVWLLDVAVLFATLRFLPTVRNLGAIEAPLRQGDVADAANILAEWRGEPVETDDAGAIARLAAEQALREAHHGAFALLFWFLLLPGPLGIVIHALAQRAAQTWADLADPAAAVEGEIVDNPDFGWFAGRAFRLIDWIPQRVTAFVFAIVGNFEDALYCWRMQAASWIRAEEGIVLASGAGALGVRLGEPIAVRGAFVARPALGTGDPAREDALTSLEGLLWRALGVWLVFYGLIAALQVA